MKVTLRTLMAGPDRIVQPGETADLPEEQARELVKLGYATPTDAEAEVAVDAELDAETNVLRSRGKRA